jgi:hypothetical protein
MSLFAIMEVGMDFAEPSVSRAAPRRLVAVLPMVSYVFVTGALSYGAGTLVGKAIRGYLEGVARDALAIAVTIAVIVLAALYADNLVGRVRRLAGDSRPVR